MGLAKTPSFDQVVLPHLDAAYDLARWLTTDATAAEDIVQDAVMRALSYFDSFRGGEARAWFLRIVRNTAYDALDARRRGTGTSLDDNAGEAIAAHLADPGDDPEAMLSGRERLATLDRALASLPTELRECLVLHELEEMSYKDVAAITGVPVGTVMSRLFRARQVLLRWQAPEGGR